MNARRRCYAFMLVLVACLACLGLAACKSDADKAKDAVDKLMSSYVVPVADENGNMPDDAAWPASDYGDQATLDALGRYGVLADDWHTHCFKNFSYTMGDATVDADTAQVKVSVTNQSLAAASDAAAGDFTAFTQSTDSESVYQQGGKPALFSKLVEYLYARLDANANPVTTEVTVTCKKDQDGNWVPQVQGDAAFFSALYGGSNVVGGLANALDGSADAAADAGSGA